MRGKLTTGRFEVDAVAVEDKRPMCCVNTDSNRPVFIESQLQSLCISRRDVGVALDTGRKLGGVHVAKSILFTEGQGILNSEPWREFRQDYSQSQAAVNHITSY